MTLISNPTRPDRLLRVPEVLKRIGISRSLWWQWCKDGRAPKGIKISTRVTVWRESDIDALFERLINVAQRPPVKPAGHDRVA